MTTKDLDQLRIFTTRYAANHGLDQTAADMAYDVAADAPDQTTMYVLAAATIRQLAIPAAVIEPIRDFARESGCDPDATLIQVAEAGLDWDADDATDRLLDLLGDICPLPCLTLFRADIDPEGLDIATMRDMACVLNAA